VETPLEATDELAFWPDQEVLVIDSRYGTVDGAGEIVVFSGKIGGDLELTTDGTDDVYVAVNPDDDFVMAAAADGTYWVPAGAFSRVIPVPPASEVVVHLMTDGPTVAYCLAPTPRP
jgi:hypothetical protein